MFSSLALRRGASSLLSKSSTNSTVVSSLAVGGLRPTAASFSTEVVAKSEDSKASKKGVSIYGDVLDDDEADLPTVVEENLNSVQKRGRGVIWASPEADTIPAPYLPKDINELVVLDPTDVHVRKKADGTDKLVIIRQDVANVKQSPLEPEKRWKISHLEDGITAEKWTNSLMGWTSNSNPYQCDPPLYFENAKDAVYFAKKRGWKFIIKEPLKRQVRNDGKQYQDNFLPQAIASRIMKEKTSCDYWHRSEAGTSHYFRPLKYHGTGVVPQHGPNGGEEIAPHVPGSYKMR